MKKTELIKSRMARLQELMKRLRAELKLAQLIEKQKVVRQQRKGGSNGK